MKNLFDAAFWRFLSGFVLILLVSISLLALVGNYRGVRDQVAALLSSIGGRN